MALFVLSYLLQFEIFYCDVNQSISLQTSNVLEPTETIISLINMICIVHPRIMDLTLPNANIFVFMGGYERLYYSKSFAGTMYICNSILICA